MASAAEIGASLGLDVEGSRARHALARVRYRAAISAALDRLCGGEPCDGTPITREPVPYADAGMTYPFERRETNGRGETQDHAHTTDPWSAGPVVRSDGDTRPADRAQRPVPVSVRVPEGSRGYLV